MKILDKYILRSFIYTFLTVFVILFLIFILQTVWLFIGELAGKDLDLALILKFLIYKMPSVVPLVLPLSVVLASIMTFGNFAENYEFAAMKSAGISLRRAMTGLSVFILLLSLASFAFANNVIPYAEYKFINFRRNLAQVKPAMAIAEGQFSDVGLYNIKVEKKSGDNGNHLAGVTIHKKGERGAGNNVVIKAKTGELVSNEQSNILKLILRDGFYYEDIVPKKMEDRKKLPFAKSSFKEYTINIDLSKLNNANLNEEKITNTNTMLTVGELSYTLDSLENNREKEIKSFTDNIYQRTGITNVRNNVAIKQEANNVPKDLLSILTVEMQSEVLKVAHNNVSGTGFSIDSSKFEAAEEKKNINNHWIALYDKFVIAFSCFLMFFIGAPLGAIIRKGGLGLPIVFAVLVFIIFHFANTFGKKLAQEDGITPFMGTWLSTFLLGPLAIVLTHRATNDRQIAIDFDWIAVPVKRVFGPKAKPIAAADRLANLDVVRIEKDAEWDELNSHEDETLVNMVYNSAKFGYSKQIRLKALKLLEQRGITQEDLMRDEKLYNRNFESLQENVEAYKYNGKATFVIYLIVVVLLLILQNNQKLMWILIPSLVFIVAFYVSLFKTEQRLSEIEKLTQREIGPNIYIALLLGFPFYFLFYFTNRNALKRALVESNV